MHIDFIAGMDPDKRRRPEETVLYQIIQNYWLTFVDKVEVIDEKGLPAYVKTEFAEFTLRV